MGQVSYEALKGMQMEGQDARSIGEHRKRELPDEGIQKKIKEKRLDQE